MSQPMEYIWPGIIVASWVLLTCSLSAQRTLLNSPSIPAHTRPRLSACCAPLVLWVFLPSHPTVGSATRH